MHSRKKILKFILTATLIYIMFSVPSTFIDEVYGDFYRKTGNKFFSVFHHTGFALFSSTAEAKYTRVSVGNRRQINKFNQADTQQEEFSTRLRGYLPTLLLVSLIIASPIPLKRKLYSLLAGLIIITAWIVFKQWIHLLKLIIDAPFLKLDDFSGMQRKLILQLYYGVVQVLTPSFVFAVVTWVLATFRKEDFISAKQVQDNSAKP